MKKIMNIAVTTAILAVPAFSFASNLDNAANFSRAAMSAGDLNASRDLAAKALEGVKFEQGSVAVPAARPMAKVNLAAAKVMLGAAQEKTRKQPTKAVLRLPEDTFPTLTKYSAIIGAAVGGIVVTPTLAGIIAGVFILTLGVLTLTVVAAGVFRLFGGHFELTHRED